MKAKDCIIHRIYTYAVDAEYHKSLYCKNNCQFKCAKNQPYKKR